MPNIQKKTRTLIAKKYAKQYYSAIKDDPFNKPNNVEISDSIGTIHLCGESAVDVSSLLLDATFDKRGRLHGVEVRNEEGKILFVEPVEQKSDTAMKTEIVFVNEGKGTVRKFEITVPTNTV